MPRAVARAEEVDDKDVCALKVIREDARAEPVCAGDAVALDAEAETEDKADWKDDGEDEDCLLAAAEAVVQRVPPVV